MRLRHGGGTNARESAKSGGTLNRRTVGPALRPKECGELNRRAPTGARIPASHYASTHPSKASAATLNGSQREAANGVAVS